MAKIAGICDAKRKYLSPVDMDHKDYFEHLVAFNSAIFYDAQTLFDEFFRGNAEHVSICTTGSDSRLEKGPRSDMEVVVISHDKNSGISAINDISIIIEQCEGLSFDADIELKSIDQGDLSYTFLDNKVLLVSPDRMFDMCYLTGNNYLFKVTRKKFLDEITDYGYGKRLLEKVTDRLRGHKKLTESGQQLYKGEVLEHFNLEKGVVNYDPHNNLWSFKQGPLRSIQLALVRDIMRGIRKESFDPKYAFTCPGSEEKLSTNKKLSYFMVRDLMSLSETSVKDLKDCYNFFLWSYHVSETNFYEYGNSCIGLSDIAGIKDRLDFVKNICSKPILKY